MNSENINSLIKSGIGFVALFLVSLVAIELESPWVMMSAICAPIMMAIVDVPKVSDSNDLEWLGDPYQIGANPEKTDKE